MRGDREGRDRGRRAGQSWRGQTWSQGHGVAVQKGLRQWAGSGQAPFTGCCSDGSPSRPALGLGSNSTAAERSTLGPMLPRL